MLVGAVLLYPIVVMRAAQAEDDVPPKLAFVAPLQKAVGADDKAWLVAHLHVPVHYYGAKTRVIRSRAWFLSHYASVMSKEVKAAVLAQDPDQVFENWQGLMVGDRGRNLGQKFWSGSSPSTTATEPTLGSCETISTPRCRLLL